MRSQFGLMKLVIGFGGLFACLLFGASSGAATPIGINATLKCEGEWTTYRDNGKSTDPAILSVTFNGQKVMVEDLVPIDFNDDTDVVAFGNELVNGSINRVTGAALITLRKVMSQKYYLLFEGTCHKAARVF